MELSLISEKLQAGRAKEVVALVQQALDEGMSAQSILQDGLMAGMAVVGVRFKNGEAFVPEVLVAARAMNKGAAVLKPHLAAEGAKATGRVCLGTVQGDYHDVGKNLVKMMLESKGLEVIDLGTDVPPDAFIKTAQEQNCAVICFTKRGQETAAEIGDWLSRQDPAAINDEVRAASDAVVPVDALPVKADPDAALRSDAFSQGPLTRLIRRLTLNGWLLPAKRRPVVVELYRPPMQYFFRADTVVKVDRFTRRATLSRRSYREALALLRRLRRVEKAVDAGYDAAAAAYRARRDHLCSEAFWRAFLGF